MLARTFRELVSGNQLMKFHQLSKFHLHYAKLQLDLNQNHVMIMDPSNTGIAIAVNINAHQQDTANGISNHNMDHHQLINQTHAM
jgi:uracil phosphoribosyltransferase